MERSAGGKRMSDRSFFVGSCLLLAAVAAVITAIAGVFSLRVWELGDTRIFFAMADVILHGGVPYVDYVDPKPPLIFFTLTLPLLVGQRLAGGLFLVWLADVVSAVAVLSLGWRLYGRAAGLLAGLLFAVNLAWAEGYFVLTEPFTLTFLLLSTYLLVCSRAGLLERYALAGVCAGIAVGFKQYALLIIPVSIIFLLVKREWKGFLPYLAGLTLPLAIVFGAIFLVYGAPAGLAALHWSFGVAGSYVTEGSVEGIPSYRIDDPVIALAWLALGTSLFSPLLVLAAAAAVARKPSLYEGFFLLGGLVFGATLAIRPFLHYWVLPLPFIVLLCVSLCSSRPGFTPTWAEKIGRRTRVLLSASACCAILLGFTLISGVLVDAIWRPLDIQRFYGLADILLKATTSVLSHVPEPALLVVNLQLPQLPDYPSLTGLLVTAGLCLCGAVLVGGLTARSYGAAAGFFSSLFFAVFLGWPIGYLLISDAVALLLVIVALYVLVPGAQRGYLPAGLCLGFGILFKPLLLVVLPVFVVVAYFQGRLPAALGLAGSAIVMPAVFSFITLATLGGVGGLALVYVEPAIFGGGYSVADPLIAMINLVMALTMLTVVVLFAAGALARKPVTAIEAGLFTAGLLLVVLPLLARQFTHYWFMALPFFVIVCARYLTARDAD